MAEDNQNDLPSVPTFDYFPPENDANNSNHNSVLDLATPFRDEAVNGNDSSERILYYGEQDEDSLLSPTHLHQPLLSPATSEEHQHRHQRRRERRDSAFSTDRAELSGLNYLNFVTYLAHLFVNWGIGVGGLFGVLETRWEILRKYETLLTPCEWAYYLWAPILIMEGVFAFCQMLPRFRARPIIQVGGTGFYFFYTFLIQTAWTLFFSFKLFIPSFVTVVAALLSLITLLVLQQSTLGDGGGTGLFSWTEYILFRFPFYLHTGWMVLMTADHFSLLFRHFTPNNIAIQLTTDIVGLGGMLAIAVVCLYQPRFRKDFVIPMVILYSYVSTLF